MQFAALMLGLLAFGAFLHFGPRWLFCLPEDDE